MDPHEVIEKFLLELMACNAVDGVACGLTGAVQMKTAIARALAGISPNDGPKEFMRSLRLECLGDPDSAPVPARPICPPFASLETTPLQAEQLSTVVTLPKFLDLIHENDRKRLELFHGITLTSTGSSGGEALLDTFEEKNEVRLARIQEKDRQFRLSPDESHGRPYLWFTSRKEFDEYLSSTSATNRTAAEIARDALGLVHHKKTMYGSDKPLHLVALHFPMAAAMRAGHLRPSAVQAFDNRRFIQTFPQVEPSPPGLWGRTIDLHTFRVKRGVVPVGCSERVLVRLQEQVLDPSERLTFNYLGRVHSERGDLAKVDGDTAFLELVRRARSIDHLVGEIWP
jgi:hypothetical protein